MEALTKYGFAFLLIGLLAAIYFTMGVQVAVFGLILAIIWFLITFVLTTRPPGIPELKPEEDSDEQQIVRRDLFEPLPVADRIRISFGVACGACLLLWMTLSLLRA